MQNSVLTCQEHHDQSDNKMGEPIDLRRQFERDGHILLRNFFSAQKIEEVKAEANALLERKDLQDTNNLRCRWATIDGKCRFETYDPVIDISERCRELARSPELLNLLAHLYGEPACLFKDKLIYKPPGCKGYGLHQDWIAWDGFPRSFLTVLIPIDAATRENGCTIVYPGYHQQGALSKEDGQYHELPIDCVKEDDAVFLEMMPGDVAIFGGFVPHRSATNLSDTWRRQLFISYNKLSDGGDQYKSHYQEFHQWLRKRYAEHNKFDVYFK